MKNQCIKVLRKGNAFLLDSNDYIGEIVIFAEHGSHIRELFVLVTHLPNLKPRLLFKFKVQYKYI